MFMLQSNCFLVAGHLGINVVTKEEYEEKGMPDDDKLVNEWIEEGGKFKDKGKAKRCDRPDRVSDSGIKKAASARKSYRSAN